MDQKLPNEILTQIFEYLPPHSLHTAAKVNTHWSQIVKILGVRWLDFSLIHDNDEKRIITHIKNKIPSDADGVRVHHILVLNNRLLRNNVFLFIQRMCPNVISFDYDPDLLNINTIASANVTQLHPFLGGEFGWRFIKHLPACHRYSDFPWTDPDLCLRLESLYTRIYDFNLQHGLRDSIPLSMTGSFFSHLDDLTIHIPIRAKETAINGIHDQCPRLTTLTLRDMKLTCLFCRQFKRQLTFSSTVPNLKVLTLENVTFLNHETFDYFPSKYPNIQTLTLSTTHHYRDNVLSICPNYSDALECVYNMVIRFKHLIQLMVHFHDNFGVGKDSNHRRCTWLQDKLEEYYCSQPTTSSSPHHQQRFHFEVICA